MRSRLAKDNPGLRKIFGPGTETGTLSLAAISQRAQRQLSKFDLLVRQELAVRGIAIPPGIGLLACPKCALRLESDHPNTRELQQWLEGNTKIAKCFKEVEVLFELVRATEAPGQIFSADSCFHIGITRAGPVAYFQDHVCCIPDLHT